MNELQINRPCPVLLSRMEQSGGDYFCQSCSKKIMDFRTKSPEEISRSVTSDTCGIFTADQLPGQRKTGFFRQGLFYALTVLSFFGFHVGPLNAASPRKSKPIRTQTELRETVLQEEASGDQEEDKKKRPKKKKQKAATLKVIGTPSF